MKKNSFTTSTRAYIGFATLILLNVGLIFFATYTINMISTTWGESADIDLAYLKNTIELKADMNRMTTEILKFLIIQEPGEMKKIEQGVQDRKNDIDSICKEMKIIDVKLHKADVLIAFTKFTDSYREYSRSIDEEMGLVLSKKKVEATTFAFTKIVDRAEKLRNLILDLEHLSYTNYKKMVADSDEEQSRMKTLFFIIGFFTTAISFYITFATGKVLTESENARLYARNLIEIGIDPLLTISADGKILDVNESTKKLTGKTRDELIGSSFAELFTDPKRAEEGYRIVFEKGIVIDYPCLLYTSPSPRD